MTGESVAKNLVKSGLPMKFSFEAAGFCNLIFFSNKLARSVVYFICFTLTLFNSEVMAMGERYTEQGGKLSAATVEVLISDGFCRTSQECHSFLPGYVAHGDRVRIAFYGVGEKNIQALNAVIGLVIKDGIRITDGVPITITGYRELYEEYRKSGIFWKSVEPFLILEVNK